MNNPDLGQVFTSPVIADYMVSLFSISKNARILDPCFGGGAFLKALNKVPYKNVTGFEIDKQWYDIAIKNYTGYSITLGDFLSVDSSIKYDGIIMNPPYIRHEKIDDLAVSGITKDILFNNPLFKDLPRTANMYMFFIVKAIDTLCDNGEMVVIFPSSWMTARGGKCFKRIIEERVDITDQTDVYGEVFEGSALVEVSILKMVKTETRHKTRLKKVKVEKGVLVYDDRKESETAFALPTPFIEYGVVRRGLTTGCNTIFINPPLNTTECLLPIISSPKDFSGFNTDSARLDNLLYVEKIDDANEEVKDYLRLCEERIQASGEPKSLIGKIVNHQPWYKLNLFPCDGIIFSYFVRNDIRFSLNTTDAVIRDNFYVIHPHGDIGNYLMMALLNNYFTYLQLENAGKKYGAGLLKIQRYDIEGLRFIDLRQLTEDQIKQLTKYGERLTTTNDITIIESITKIMSELLGITVEQVIESYRTAKKNRLERV